MPNYVTNILKIIDHDKQNINNILNFIKGENNKKISFNKIIPMPESLLVNLSIDYNDVESIIKKNKSCNEEDLIKKIKSIFPNQYGYTEVKTIVQNYFKYGYSNWYDWRIDNWNTKWDAGGTPHKLDTDNTIIFTTAWNHPYNVIKTLSNMFKTTIFELKYADENIGSNFGLIIFYNNDVLSLDNECLNKHDSVYYSLKINLYSEDEIEEFIKKFSYEEQL